MTRKIYKTAQGKMVDIGALQLRNENVRAVGNMGVNARGDLVDSQNRPIQSRNDQVNRQYRKQTSNVNDAPVSSSSVAPAAAPDIPPPPEDFDDDFQKPVEVQPAEATPPAGLAGAIARARQIKQEPLKAPTLAQKSGVTKI